MLDKDAFDIEKFRISLTEIFKLKLVSKDLYVVCFTEE